MTWEVGRFVGNCRKKNLFCLLGNKEKFIWQEDLRKNPLEFFRY